jgi:hypothetical protein
MQIQMVAKVWWSERDMANLNVRMRNEDRILSIAPSSGFTSTGDDVATLVSSSQTLALYVDRGGMIHQITSGVLGQVLGDEYTVSEFLPQALEWLMKGNDR